MHGGVATDGRGGGRAAAVTKLGFFVSEGPLGRPWEGKGLHLGYEEIGDGSRVSFHCFEPSVFDVIGYSHFIQERSRVYHGDEGIEGEAPARASTSVGILCGGEIRYLDFAVLVELNIHNARRQGLCYRRRVRDARRLDEEVLVPTSSSEILHLLVIPRQYPGMNIGVGGRDAVLQTLRAGKTLSRCFTDNMRYFRDKDGRPLFPSW